MNYDELANWFLKTKAHVFHSKKEAKRNFSFTPQRIR